ncbi:Vacuolar protein 14 C-terminal Fig4p binding domain-containing protein [Forsythia ovata]|uniref:Vacuolar protein 14 C-terminal Fig4p binding domain-containing protein n=1 Tax=Forsythia ovata TaxID=205694 RepID=A0ABD1UYL3_9LAMI
MVGNQRGCRPTQQPTRLLSSSPTVGCRVTRQPSRLSGRDSEDLALVGDHDKVTSVINLLAAEFTHSPLANHRKQIVPPVLYSFSDQDSRVRYYACEALYNIAKRSVGDALIVLFNQIFEALCKLSADSDPNVQSAAYLLDRLVKDIVTEGDQFRFQISKDEDKLGIGAGRMVPIETSCAYMAKERILLPEKLAKLKSNIGADATSLHS